MICTKCNQEKDKTCFYFRKDHNCYRKECKICWGALTKEFKYDKYPWRKHFYAARRRCQNKFDTAYYHYKHFTFALTMEEIKTLWIRDNANNMKHPSIDRKDSLIGYNFKNCRFIEHSLNSSLANQSTKMKPVLQYDLNGVFIKEWDCAKTVNKILQFDNGDIAKVCMGKSKTCNGYIWRYKNA